MTQLNSLTISVIRAGGINWSPYPLCCGPSDAPYCSCIAEVHQGVFQGVSSEVIGLVIYMITLILSLPLAPSFLLKLKWLSFGFITS